MNRNIQHFLDLVLVLTQKEVKVRYKNSVLGYLWSIGHPLAYTAVFWIAFKIVMRINMENYLLFLITGLFPWQWFANSVNVSPIAYISNAQIIKKVSFPRNIIPLTIVLQDMIHFVFTLPVIGLVMHIYGKHPSAAWIAGIPLMLFLQLIFTYGISLVVSTVNLFFRDLERLTGILVTFIFYFTPIVYSYDMIPEQYRGYANLNPLTPFMVGWRSLFLDSAIDFHSLSLCAIYAVISLVLGHLVYRSLSWRFGEVI